MRRLALALAVGCGGSTPPPAAPVPPAPAPVAPVAPVASEAEAAPSPPAPEAVPDSTPDLVPGAAVPTVRAAESSDHVAIRTEMKHHTAELAACYERFPDAGRQMLTFTIGADGRVLATSVTGFSAEATPCFVGVLRSCKFPPSADHGTTQVSYPIELDLAR